MAVLRLETLESREVPSAVPVVPPELILPDTGPLTDIEIATLTVDFNAPHQVGVDSRDSVNGVLANANTLIALNVSNVATIAGSPELAPPPREVTVPTELAATVIDAANSIIWAISSGMMVESSEPPMTRNFTPRPFVSPPPP